MVTIAVALVLASSTVNDTLIPKGMAATVDGVIGDQEWDDAASIVVGSATVWLKHDGTADQGRSGSPGSALVRLALAWLTSPGLCAMVVRKRGLAPRARPTTRNTGGWVPPWGWSRRSGSFGSVCVAWARRRG